MDGNLNPHLNKMSSQNSLSLLKNYEPIEFLVKIVQELDFATNMN